MNRPDLASKAQAAEHRGAPLLDRALRPAVPARGSRSPPR
jgi:hypothetical protein